MSFLDYLAEVGEAGNDFQTYASLGLPTPITTARSDAVEAAKKRRAAAGKWGGDGKLQEVYQGSLDAATGDTALGDLERKKKEWDSLSDYDKYRARFSVEQARERESRVTEAALSATIGKTLEDIENGNVEDKRDVEYRDALYEQGALTGPADILGGLTLAGNVDEAMNLSEYAGEDAVSILLHSVARGEGRTAFIKTLEKIPQEERLEAVNNTVKRLAEGSVLEPGQKQTLEFLKEYLDHEYTTKGVFSRRSADNLIGVMDAAFALMPSSYTIGTQTAVGLTKIAARTATSKLVKTAAKNEGFAKWATEGRFKGETIPEDMKTQGDLANEVMEYLGWKHGRTVTADMHNILKEVGTGGRLAMQEMVARASLAKDRAMSQWIASGIYRKTGVELPTGESLDIGPKTMKALRNLSLSGEQVTEESVAKALHGEDVFNTFYTQAKDAEEIGDFVSDYQKSLVKEAQETYENIKKGSQYFLDQDNTVKRAEVINVQNQLVDHHWNGIEVPTDFEIEKIAKEAQKNSVLKIDIEELRDIQIAMNSDVSTLNSLRFKLNPRQTSIYSFDGSVDFNNLSISRTVNDSPITIGDVVNILGSNLHKMDNKKLKIALIKLGINSSLNDLDSAIRNIRRAVSFEATPTSLFIDINKALNSGVIPKGDIPTLKSGIFNYLVNNKNFEISKAKDFVDYHFSLMFTGNDRWSWIGVDLLKEGHSTEEIFNLFNDSIYEAIKQTTTEPISNVIDSLDATYSSRSKDILKHIGFEIFMSLDQSVKSKPAIREKLYSLLLGVKDVSEFKGGARARELAIKNAMKGALQPSIFGSIEDFFNGIKNRGVKGNVARAEIGNLFPTVVKEKMVSDFIEGNKTFNTSYYAGLLEAKKFKDFSTYLPKPFDLNHVIFTKKGESAVKISGSSVEEFNKFINDNYDDIVNYLGKDLSNLSEKDAKTIWNLFFSEVRDNPYMRKGSATINDVETFFRELHRVKQEGKTDDLLRDFVFSHSRDDREEAENLFRKLEAIYDKELGHSSELNEEWLYHISGDPTVFQHYNNLYDLTKLTKFKGTVINRTFGEAVKDYLIRGREHGTYNDTLKTYIEDFVNAHKGMSDSDIIKLAEKGELNLSGEQIEKIMNDPASLDIFYDSVTTTTGPIYQQVIGATPYKGKFYKTGAYEFNNVIRGYLKDIIAKYLGTTDEKEKQILSYARQMFKTTFSDYPLFIIGKANKNAPKNSLGASGFNYLSLIYKENDTAFFPTDSPEKISTFIHELEHCLTLGHIDAFLEMRKKAAPEMVKIFREVFIPNLKDYVAKNIDLYKGLKKSRNTLVNQFINEAKTGNIDNFLSKHTPNEIDSTLYNIWWHNGGNRAGIPYGYSTIKEFFTTFSQGKLPISNPKRFRELRDKMIDRPYNFPVDKIADVKTGSLLDWTKVNQDNVLKYLQYDSSLIGKLANAKDKADAVRIVKEHVNSNIIKAITETENIKKARVEFEEAYNHFINGGKVNEEDRKVLQAIRDKSDALNKKPEDVIKEIKSGKWDSEVIEKKYKEFKLDIDSMLSEEDKRIRKMISAADAAKNDKWISGPSETDVIKSMHDYSESKADAIEKHFDGEWKKFFDRAEGRSKPWNVIAQMRTGGNNSSIGRAEATVEAMNGNEYTSMGLDKDQTLLANSLPTVGEMKSPLDTQHLVDLIVEQSVDVISEEQRGKIHKQLSDKIKKLKGTNVDITVEGTFAKVRFTISNDGNQGWKTLDEALEQHRKLIEDLEDMGLREQEITVMGEAPDGTMVPVQDGVDYGRYYLTVDHINDISHTFSGTGDMMNKTANILDRVPMLRWLRRMSKVASSTFSEALMRPLLAAYDKKVGLVHLGFAKEIQELQKKFKAVQTDRLNKVYDTLIKQNRDKVRYTSTDLRAMGHTTEEISAINGLVDMNEHLWDLKNLVNARKLSSIGYKAVETKAMGRRIGKLKSDWHSLDDAEQIIDSTTGGIVNKNDIDSSFVVYEFPTASSGEPKYFAAMPNDRLSAINFKYDRTIGKIPGYTEMRLKDNLIFIDDGKGNTIGVAATTRGASDFLQSNKGIKVNPGNAEKYIRKDAFSEAEKGTFRNVTSSVMQSRDNIKLADDLTVETAFVDPLEAMDSSIAWVSEQVQLNPVLQQAQKDFVEMYGHLCNNTFPKSIDLIKGGNAGEVGAAKSVYHYLSQITNSVERNDLSTLWKATNNAIAEVLGKATLEANKYSVLSHAMQQGESLLLKSARKDPIGYSRRLTSAAYIAWNPIRQAILQGIQLVNSFGLNPKAFVTGKTWDMTMDAFLYVSGIKKTPKYSKFVDMMERMGILTKESSVSYVADAISLAKENERAGLNPFKWLSKATGKASMGALYGEKTQQLFHAAAYFDLMESKYGIEWFNKKAHFDKFISDVRVMTGSQSPALRMPWENGIAGMIFQFAQSPFKMNQILFNTQIPLSARLRIVGTELVAFGMSGYALGVTQRLLGDELYSRLDESTREVISGGIFDLCVHKAFGIHMDTKNFAPTNVSEIMSFLFKVSGYEEAEMVKIIAGNYDNEDKKRHEFKKSVDDRNLIERVWDTASPPTAGFFRYRIAAVAKDILNMSGVIGNKYDEKDWKDLFKDTIGLFAGLKQVDRAYIAATTGKFLNSRGIALKEGLDGRAAIGLLMGFNPEISKEERKKAFKESAWDNPKVGLTMAYQSAMSYFNKRFERVSNLTDDQKVERAFQIMEMLATTWTDGDPEKIYKLQKFIYKRVKDCQDKPNEMEWVRRWMKGRLKKGQSIFNESLEMIKQTNPDDYLTIKDRLSAVSKAQDNLKFYVNDDDYNKEE